MMDMGRISEIRQRISEIEHQFGAVKKINGMDFSHRLQKEMKKMQDVQKTTSVKEEKAAPVKDSKVEKGKSDFGMKPGMPGADPKLEDMIRAAAQKYGVDSSLVSAVAEAESGGDQSAVSEAGAIGIMQLMPGTAEALGVNPYDAQQNLEGGAKYLRQMLDSFDGDVRKAVAAYNAGPQAVKKYGGVPPYAETQDYVDKVLDIYR